jgi:purine-nucleoside phosphorylase
MYTRENYERDLDLAEARLRKLLGIGDDDTIETALVLGTGWGDAIEVEDDVIVPMGYLRFFNDLPLLASHKRQYELGTIGGRRVLVLRGRLHLNDDTYDPMVRAMVMMQTDLLLRLGAKTLIVTNAAGSLTSDIAPKSILAIDGFVSLFTPVPLLFGGEFCTPDDTLDDELMKIADSERAELKIRRGSYAMVRGPHFEGRRYDKMMMHRLGAHSVGMSTLPACITVAYRNEHHGYGVRVLALSFITNDPHEEMSDDLHRRRIKEMAEPLSAFLKRILGRLPS